MIRKRPLTLEEAYGAWVAATDNLMDWSKNKAHRRESLVEAEEALQRARERVEDAEDQERFALNKANEARGDLDAAIRALDPARASEEIARVITTSTRPRR